MRDYPQIRIRPSNDLKDQIERSATANNRSMNAEIIAQLTKAYSGDDVSERLDRIEKLLEDIQNA